MLLQYNFKSMSPAYDVLPFFSLAIMQLSFMWNTCDIKEMPVFQPNEYLFTTHADKGKERWEIFAWAVRDVLSKAGPMPTNNQPYHEKLLYEVAMGKKKKAIQNQSPIKEPLLSKDNEANPTKIQ